MTPRTFGTYRIQSELGRGGMGVVYRAHDPSLQRFVAIKTLTAALAHNADIKTRFLREARSMAGISSPHVLSVFSTGEEQGQPYFVMELIDGESLSSLFKRQGVLPVHDAARLIQQAALGLGAAHAKGVIHRDIKPGNLLLTRKGQLKVADFGIARSVAGDDQKLTLTGEFMGTPGYLSPEVCTGKAADARSDVFSLGIVLFECLTGRVPFLTDSPLALMLNVVQSDLPDVQELNALVDDRLVAILHRMVAKNPEDRYPNGLAVAAALGAYLQGKGSTLTVMPQAATAPSNLAAFTLPPPNASPMNATRVSGASLGWSFPKEEAHTHRGKEVLAILMGILAAVTAVWVLFLP